MDVKKYQSKMLDKTMVLLHQVPSNDTEKAIIDLEMIICSISPYGRWWRRGYIKSLRMAIQALKDNEHLKVERDNYEEQLFLKAMKNIVEVANEK